MRSFKREGGGSPIGGLYTEVRRSALVAVSLEEAGGITEGRVLSDAGVGIGSYFSFPDKGADGLTFLYAGTRRYSPST